MDSSQFDALARHLGRTRSRRDALTGVVGGALGLVGLAESLAKGKGGGKGKGKKKKKKKNKTEDTCAKVGTGCQLSCGVGDPCCHVWDCDCRQDLYCLLTDPNSAVGTCGCLAGAEMVNGRCGTKPDCIPAGQHRGFYDKPCCSGSEVTDINDPAVGTCLPGVLDCLSDADCTGGSCRGYACRAQELDCSIFVP